jgi:hypothetical protein
MNFRIMNEAMEEPAEISLELDMEGMLFYFVQTIKGEFLRGGAKYKKLW